MKIRIASLILAIGLVLLMVTSSLADEETELVQVVQEPAEPAAVFYLDGEPLEDVTAQSINGTYYVALRTIAPLIDETAMVEEGSGTITVTARAIEVTQPEQPDEAACVEVLDTLTLSAVEGEHYVTANGRYLYVKDGVRTLDDGMMAVPVRVLAEAMNLSVHYEAESGQVQLTRSEQPGYLEDAETYYDADSLYWLSRIIYCESGNQSLAGKIAVGNVVLNRVNDPKFPNTIYDVIFQKNQFSPAASGSIYRDPNAESVVAAKLVLDGAQVLEDVLFFNRAGMSSYASRNRTYVATIGAHSFYA